MHDGQSPRLERGQFGEVLAGRRGGFDAKWPRRSTRRATTIRHALEFSTWRSLDRLTGSDRRAAALAAGWI